MQLRILCQGLNGRDAPSTRMDKSSSNTTWQTVKIPKETDDVRTSVESVREQRGKSGSGPVVEDANHFYTTVTQNVFDIEVK